jgi:hypothetical protein
VPAKRVSVAYKFPGAAAAGMAGTAHRNVSGSLYKPTSCPTTPRAGRQALEKHRTACSDLQGIPPSATCSSRVRFSACCWPLDQAAAGAAAGRWGRKARTSAPPVLLKTREGALRARLSFLPPASAPAPHGAPQDRGLRALRAGGGRGSSWEGGREWQPGRANLKGGKTSFSFIFRECARR